MEWIEELRRRGVTTLERFTHDQQVRLADGLGLDVTDLHREWGRNERQRRTGAPSARSRSAAGTRRSKPVAPAVRERDIVGNIGDRLDADQELRTMFPATLAAVDEISDRMGLDRSKSPSLRQAYIEVHVKGLYARGRVPAGSKDGDRAWTLYQRYNRLLQRANSLDHGRFARRDKARASLRRQEAAAVAVSRGR